jgi:hypothetical protein
MLGPRTIKFDMEVGQHQQKTPVGFEGSRSKVKVTVNLITEMVPRE